MKKELKAQVIETISAQIRKFPNFYIADISGLNAGQTFQLRRECFREGIKLSVVKNTLLEKAIRAADNEEMNLLIPTFVGSTAILYSESPNAPAKLIKKCLKSGMEKPVLKGAYVQECTFVGADRLDELASIKSKEELVGDIVALLQSPARNVLSALQSAGGCIAGIVKTLSEKE